MLESWRAYFALYVPFMHSPASQTTKSSS